MKQFWILACFVSVSGGMSCSGLDPPAWPKAYSVRGNISAPMAEVHEPFLGFYDKTAGNSRIDYWGGNVKTYQSKGPFNGFMRRVVHLAKESLFIQICVHRNGHVWDPVQPQTVLPDLAKYACADISEKDGIQTQKWIYVQSNYIRTTKFTMWLTMESKDNVSIPLPLRFEVKDYDGVLGSITDHYFLLYDLFSSDPPPATVWKLDSGITCSDWQDEKVKELSRFNPIREYIENSDDYVNDAWAYHLKTYNKTYTGLEQLIRRQTFKQNRRFVFSRNRGGKGFKLKLNRFADWSQQELDTLKGRKFLPAGNNSSVFPVELIAKDIPTHLDWRLLGLKVPVKDQGMCGSGWAFAAAGALEGANFVSTGSSVDMSVQALMDCSWNFGNDGCDGGDDFRAFRWVMSNGGLPSSDDYVAYARDDGFCHVNQTVLHGPIKEYVNVVANDATALRVALFHNGPISIAIQASSKSFIFYSSGVYSDPACLKGQEDLDHYALLVGYGDLNGKNYWLVKNSWSSSWGHDGYILIATDNNVCGVMTNPTQVIT